MARVIWTSFAQQTLFEIWSFLAETGIRYANLFANKINDATLALRFAKQYQLENSLAEPYRRIICGHYKIIYTVKSDSITIVIVFDSRQDPNKLFLK